MRHLRLRASQGSSATTRLLKNRADLVHVKHYLGQISDEMAPARPEQRPHRSLGHLPGASEPGIVLSGAGLVHGHRRREQWRMLAEGAPDSATADYLHEVFECTAHAIDGPAMAVEAADLLEETLALDLRRPRTTSATAGPPLSRPWTWPTRPPTRRRRGSVTSTPASTAAAIAARRRQTRDKLTQVEKALDQLRGERGRVTVRAAAERAGVSATLLYENAEVRALAQQATADHRKRQVQDAQDVHEPIEASSRERALNARSATPDRRSPASPPTSSCREHQSQAPRPEAHSGTPHAAPDLEAQHLEQAPS
ncbi:DUF6262 family protein [Streptomyces camelliae]|uniref:DUF6262 family protein n=1 Tax=Streptomyces camelliae TaxID=3004093 RepID=A0ABY7NU08_9ACTN|nr:DUF6262 family protein [Streptomyces sp. HUAS 2-6]WBO61716.1 DUF6262 family protein [Streptomyces sp. HUAS 2-6]